MYFMIRNLNDIFLNTTTENIFSEFSRVSRINGTLSKIRYYVFLSRLNCFEKKTKTFSKKKTSEGNFNTGLKHYDCRLDSK